MKYDTITIELKEGLTSEQIDVIMKKMLNALSKSEIAYVHGAELTQYLLAVSKPLPLEENTDEDI